MPLLGSDPMKGCINVLDKNGNDTIYDQFFISHCTRVSVPDDYPSLPC